MPRALPAPPAPSLTRRYFLQVFDARRAAARLGRVLHKQCPGVRPRCIALAAARRRTLSSLAVPPHAHASPIPARFAQVEPLAECRRASPRALRGAQVCPHFIAQLQFCLRLPAVLPSLPRVIGATPPHQVLPPTHALRRAARGYDRLDLPRVVARRVRGCVHPAQPTISTVARQHAPPRHLRRVFRPIQLCDQRAVRIAQGGRHLVDALRVRPAQPPARGGIRHRRPRVEPVCRELSRECAPVRRRPLPCAILPQCRPHAAEVRRARPPRRRAEQPAAPLAPGRADTSPAQPQARLPVRLDEQIVAQFILQVRRPPFERVLPRAASQPAARARHRILHR